MVTCNICSSGRSYFKHTVYGLRFLFRMYDLEDRIIKLPTHYYHLVFTLPHQLNELCLAYPRQLYNLLMTTAWQTIDSFAWNHKFLGAQAGASMVLHTWGSNLSFHPHVRCIVPGGGVTLSGKCIGKIDPVRGPPYFKTITTLTR